MNWWFLFGEEGSSSKVRSIKYRLFTVHYTDFVYKCHSGTKLATKKKESELWERLKIVSGVNNIKKKKKGSRRNLHENERKSLTIYIYRLENNEHSFDLHSNLDDEEEV